MNPTYFVYLCFFVSGFSALLYEVAWLNRIQMVMGHTVYSLSTTLAAYMVGLALGGLALPRLKKSGVNSLYLYLIAEFTIGIYGILFQPLLSLVQIFYSAIARTYELPLVPFSLIQFFFCGILIILPTFLMGTTLPLLADHLYRQQNELSKKVSLLYAINTLGAGLGCMLSGFVILPALGYSHSIYLAAFLNISLFMSASILIPNIKAPTFSEIRQIINGLFHSKKTQRSFSAVDRVSLTLLGVSGICCMVVQVSWNRLAELVFGPSTYIFPLVTTVVLTGIVLGSLLVSKISKKESSLLYSTTFLPWIAAVLLMLGNYALTQSPNAVLYWHTQYAPNFPLYTFLCLTQLLICVLPASLFLGALFPAGTSLLTLNKKEAGEFLGFGYSINILGLVLGAIIGSFVIFPYFGLEKMESVSILLLGGVSALSAWKILKQPILGASVLASLILMLAIVPRYDFNLLTSGLFYNRTKDTSEDDLKKKGYLSSVDYRKMNTMRLLAVKDDPHATLSIHSSDEDGKTRLFKTSGKVDGNNTSDLKTTRLLIAFPMLANLNVENILTIGFGTGATATDTLLFPKVKHSEVLEISESLAKFSKQYFPEVNESFWKDPRSHITIRDGREFLQNSTQTYDLILSEPSNPWMSGVSSLFTQEFYHMVSQHLAPKGIASLWFHTYGLDCTAVFSVFSAAAKSFSSLLVFKVSSDVFMLASNDEIELRTLPASYNYLEDYVLNQVLEIPPAETPVERYKQILQSYLILNKKDIEFLSAQSPVNSDDNQYLQFQSGKTFWQSLFCHDIYYEQSRKALVDRYSDQFTKSAFYGSNP